MRYRPLGDSGLMVSVTGLGCNNFGRRPDLDATRVAELDQIVPPSAAA
jgi:aryl-alcohol dehydrogenase-like predicted oxidoreductase